MTNFLAGSTDLLQAKKREGEHTVKDPTTGRPVTIKDAEFDGQSSHYCCHQLFAPCTVRVYELTSCLYTIRLSSSRQVQLSEPGPVPLQGSSHPHRPQSGPTDQHLSSTLPACQVTHDGPHYSVTSKASVVFYLCLVPHLGTRCLQQRLVCLHRPNHRAWRRWLRWSFLRLGSRAQAGQGNGASSTRNAPRARREVLTPHA